MDGSRALRQLGADVHPFRSSVELENCLVKRIRDGHVPPGFTSLFARISQLARLA